MQQPSYDVVVVGAGPAGAAAALGALRARPTARVALVDRAAFPRDKTCGDGVAPHALDVLRELGVADVAAGFAPVDRLRLVAPGGAVAAGPFARPARVIPRLVFDGRLVEAAVSAGAELVRHRVRAVELQPDRVILDGRLDGRVVVAADGAGSVLRRAVAGPHPARHTALAIRGYAAARPAAPLEQRIVMTAGGWPAYAWSFPIGDGRANVGFGVLLPAPGRAELLTRLAELVPDEPAEPSTLRAHHLPLSAGRARQPAGRVLLAGDAAGLVNPLTGEGIYYAVESGRLAGEAAVTSDGDPGSAYRAALRARLGRHLRHTDALASATRWRPLVDTGVRAARRPGPFDDLVEIGLGRGLLTGRLLAALLRRSAG